MIKIIIIGNSLPMQQMLKRWTSSEDFAEKALAKIAELRLIGKTIEEGDNV